MSQVDDFSSLYFKGVGPAAFIAFGMPTLGLFLAHCVREALVTLLPGVTLCATCHPWVCPLGYLSHTPPG